MSFDLNSFISALSGLVVGGVLVRVLLGELIAEVKRLKAEVQGDLKRRLEACEVHAHPAMEARLAAAEAGIDPKHAGEIDQQLKTIGGQVTRIESTVNATRETMAGTTATVENIKAQQERDTKDLRDHIARVSSSAKSDVQQAETRLQQQLNHLRRAA